VTQHLPPWGTAANVYFSKFLVRPFIFRKSKKKYFKNYKQEVGKLGLNVGSINIPAQPTTTLGVKMTCGRSFYMGKEKKNVNFTPSLIIHLVCLIPEHHVDFTSMNYFTWSSTCAVDYEIPPLSYKECNPRNASLETRSATSNGVSITHHANSG
jgi:hypothetical protein